MHSPALDVLLDTRAASAAMQRSELGSLGSFSRVLMTLQVRVTG